MKHREDILASSAHIYLSSVTTVEVLVAKLDQHTQLLK